MQAISEPLRYAAVVAVALLLGVAVTAFCIRLRDWRREDHHHDRKR